MVVLFNLTGSSAELAAREMGLSEMGWPDFGQLSSPVPRYRNWGSGTNRLFGVDNGAFSGFDEKEFYATLRRSGPEDMPRCKFVACPDVVGDSKATGELFKQWRDRLEGWPVALVTQDGLKIEDVPWDRIDAVFVGGSDQWKFCQNSIEICQEAKRRGLWIHVGRVNTWKRAISAQIIGADSMDGTGLATYPSIRQRFRDGMLRYNISTKNLH